MKYKNSSAIWQHLQNFTSWHMGTFSTQPAPSTKKMNACHDNLTYHSVCEHNEIRPKFRWARSVLGTSYGFLRHRSWRQKQGTNGKQKHMLPFSPTLGCKRYRYRPQHGAYEKKAISDMQRHSLIYENPSNLRTKNIRFNKILEH